MGAAAPHLAGASGAYRADSSCGPDAKAKVSGVLRHDVRNPLPELRSTVGVVGVTELEPLPPVGCELTEPLAELLLVLCATVLGPPAGLFSTPIPPELRCRRCKRTRPQRSEHTRMKDPELWPPGLGPVQGYVCRCRTCGAFNLVTPEGVQPDVDDSQLRPRRRRRAA